jgi:hypothetical protein
MASTEDAAASQALDLEDAADDLQSNRFVLGEHHFSLGVFAESQRRLADNLSAARAALADAGLVSARKGRRSRRPSGLSFPVTSRGGRGRRQSHRGISSHWRLFIPIPQAGRAEIIGVRRSR